MLGGVGDFGVVKGKQITPPLVAEEWATARGLRHHWMGPFRSSLARLDRSLGWRHGGYRYMAGGSMVDTGHTGTVHGGMALVQQ